MITTWRAIFLRQKAFAEHALEQLDDKGFFQEPARGINSVAVIVQHMAGNLHSRWTDFLTSDGEKPDRDRDAEFIPPQPTAETRSQLMQHWQSGWHALIGTLDALTTEDLGRSITIRNQPHMVHAAIIRSMDHLAGHVGQIQVLARWHVGESNWKWFTIPPGGTVEFNRTLRGQ